MNPQFRPGPPNSALAWALLSQTLWLPLLGLDLHDRWQAQVREQREIAEATVRLSRRSSTPAKQRSAQDAPITGNGKLTDTGLLLGSASGSSLNPADRTGMVNEAGLAPTSPSRTPNPAGAPDRPRHSASASRAGKPEQRRGGSPLGATISAGWPTSVLKTYNRAELLGGNLSLSDLHTAAMPPLAMAERARWQRSGDPLAPLPGPWREPMRRALHGLAASKGASPSVSAARVVHVPSLRVRHSTPVPLAVQPDGSVDILTKPDNPAVVDEIRQWSSRQPSSAQAGVTAAVVHLEPLPEAPSRPQPSLSRTSTVAPSPAPVVTSSRPATAEPAAAPTPSTMAAAPTAATAPVAPPAPAASVSAPSAASTVPMEAGASLP